MPAPFAVPEGDGIGPLPQAVQPVVQHHLAFAQQHPLPGRGLRPVLHHRLPAAQRGDNLLLQCLGLPRAQARQRQAAGARQPLHLQGHLLRHIHRCSTGHQGHHILLQLLHQLVGGQAVHLEQFVVHHHLVFLLKAHQQPVAQKRPGGVAQKVCQARQIQGHVRVQLQRRHAGCRGGTVRGMGRMPFPGIGVQRRAVLEIPAAERLQRVLPGALRQQIPLRRGIALPALCQVVPQLGYQHRRRLLAVVAHMAPGPADVQHAARGQQCIQHQLAVVVAPGAVARALLLGLGHQVEIGPAGAARIVAVVHAQQAHHLERDGAHGHQRAEGDATGAKTLFQRRLGQRLQPGLLRHHQRQVGLESGLLARGLPAHQGLVQRGQQGLVFIAAAAEEVLQQHAKALGPHRRRGGLLRRLPPLQHALQQAGQAAGQLGAQPPHFIVGFDPGECLGRYIHGPAAGVTQQHALQAKPGTVGVTAGLQPQLGTLGMVQPPADARPGHPLRELGQCIGRQPHAVGHGRHIQQVAQLAQTAALLWQVQQPLQGRDQRTAGASPHIGNVERDMARIVAAVLAEHGAHRRRGLFNRRQHDHHITRCQRGLACARRLGQQLQQLVVQHLQLPHQAVRGVKHDGTVAGRNRQRRVLCQRYQVADALLHLGQQRCLGQVLGVGFVIHIHPRPVPLGGGAAGGVEGIQLAHIVPALPGPRGQQRMGMGVHGFQRDLRQIAPVLVRMAAAFLAQQLAPVDGIGPVKAAGIGHRNQHLAVLRNPAQELHQRQRHLAHAKHHHAARQWAHRRLTGLQCAQHPRQQRRAGGGTFMRIELSQHRTPQRRLPLLRGGHGHIRTAGVAQHILPGRPGFQPVGTVDLVLVVQVGQALGELQQALGFAGAQKVGNGGEFRQRQALRQQAHQPPDHRRLVQRRFTGYCLLAQDLAVAAPDKARRQLDPRGGTDPQRVGHAHLEPLGHAIALHQHGLGLQRLQRVRRQPRQHRIGQGLGLVAVQGNQARLPCCVWCLLRCCHMLSCRCRQAPACWSKPRAYRVPHTGRAGCGNAPPPAIALQQRLSAADPAPQRPARCRPWPRCAAGAVHRSASGR